MCWVVDLGEYDIIYEPITSLKGQAVVDFITEFTYREVIPSPNLSTEHTSLEESSAAKQAKIIANQPESSIVQEMAQQYAEQS